MYIYKYKAIYLYPQKLNLPLIMGLLAGVLCKIHFKTIWNEGYGPQLYRYDAVLDILCRTKRIQIPN